MNTSHPYDLVIGLDRSDKKADLCLIDTRTGQRRAEIIDTAPEALWEWLLELRQQHPQARVGLCLEQPAVHLIPFLEAYDWITLHPINPITLQKYREAFVTSRAKDDTKDADFLADLLLTHHAKLPVWAPEDSATRAVQQLVFHRRAVVDERTGLSNRLIALLKSYFPQALILCGDDLWRPLATAFLLKWPSLQAVQKAKAATLKQFYYLHGSRSAKLVEQRLALIEKAVPVTDEKAVIGSFALRVQLVCRQLQLVQQSVSEFDRQIAAEVDGQHGIATGTFCGGRESTALHRHRPGDEAQWRKLLYSSALSVSQVPPAKFSRVCQGKHFVEPLGGGVLSATTEQGQSAPHRRARTGIQVAADHLALLAGPQTLRRADV